MTVPIPEDPKDVRPTETQDPYPHGERCLDPKAHDIHEWSPDDKPHFKLICVGHNFCGAQAFSSFMDRGAEIEYAMTCGLDNGHTQHSRTIYEQHWDPIWGTFTTEIPVDVDED